MRLTPAILHVLVVAPGISTQSAGALIEDAAATALFADVHWYHLYDAALSVPPFAAHVPELVTTASLLDLRAVGDTEVVGSEALLTVIVTWSVAAA